MSVKIRMARGGKKKAPFYKIVATDSRMPRDGRYLEKLAVGMSGAEFFVFFFCAVDGVLVTKGKR